MAVTEQAVRDALRGVIDPELGINIVDLGLVYGVEIDDAGIRVRMTMTTPACPLGGYLQDLAVSAIASGVPGAGDVVVSLVWEPAWHPGMMSAEARQQLGGR